MLNVVVDDIEYVDNGDDSNFLPVKSADRALDVLEELARAGHLGRAELGRRLKIPKSSLHGILRTLELRGWVELDPGRSIYHLGVHSLIVGASFVDEDLVVARTSPILDALAAATGETVHLGRLQAAEIVYMAKRESVHPLRMFSAVGRRLPAYATALGKALLAQRSDDEVREILPATLSPLTPRTVRDRAELIDRLAEVRHAGYAIDNEEATVGLRCFAVALPSSAPSVNAISISVPVARLDPESEACVVNALRDSVAGQLLTT
jgi:DNA-binding IclR family transcriptional regulator